MHQDEREDALQELRRMARLYRQSRDDVERFSQCRASERGNWQKLSAASVLNLDSFIKDFEAYVSNDKAESDRILSQEPQSIESLL